MQTLTEPLPATANGRKRWTRTELEFLENACVLKGRYELLDGEIISKHAHDLELTPTANGRRRWTRTEFEFLESAGLLSGHYELLDGEIVDKMGQKSRHANAVSLVFAYLLGLFGALRVHCQATMEVRENDRVVNSPEPDLAVLREVVLAGTPSGEDVLLAVEVSDTTQADDYGPKVGLYARAGVAEYWVLDLTRRALVVYRSPQNGEWQARNEYTEGSEIAPLSAPQAPVTVADMLPPLPLPTE